HAVLVNPISWQVGSQIRSGSHPRRFWRSDVGDLDQRARPWIALAEQQEIVRMILGQHGEVRLHVSLAQSGRHARELAAADVGADLARMASVDRHERILPDSYPWPDVGVGEDRKSVV